MILGHDFKILLLKTNKCHLYLQKLHIGCIFSGSVWVQWRTGSGPDCLMGNPQMSVASVSIYPHRKTWRRKNETINVRKKRKTCSKYLLHNIAADRFKCTRRIGGTFQISSFLVESLWALQCLQKTLLLSVSFSSFENSLRQSCQETANISSKNNNASTVTTFDRTIR